MCDMMIMCMRQTRYGTRVTPSHEMHFMFIGQCYLTITECGTCGVQRWVGTAASVPGWPTQLSYTRLPKILMGCTSATASCFRHFRMSPRWCAHPRVSSSCSSPRPYGTATPGWLENICSAMASRQRLGDFLGTVPAPMGPPRGCAARAIGLCRCPRTCHGRTIRPIQAAGLALWYVPHLIQSPSTIQTYREVSRQEEM